jgi:hypothetical protein
LYADAYGMHYDIPYPPAGEGVRDYFSHNVERSVHIGMQRSPSRGTEETAMHPFAHVLLVFPDGFSIQSDVCCTLG